MGGGKSASTSIQRYDGVQVQSSLLGTAIPRGWGTFKVGANILWYGNFQSQAQKTSGGKGGGSTLTGYTYSASLVLGICKGPIAGIRDVYKDSTIYTPGSQSALQQVGLSLFTGAIGQADWTYLDTNFASQALGYSGVAYVAAANYVLDSSAAPPNHAFEVQTNIRAVIGGVTNDDALPDAILTDFLNSVPFWASSWTGTFTTYSNYCLANGFLLSPYMDSQRQASDLVTEIMTATNSNCFFADGTFQVTPYGDTAVTGNGVTWTPSLTPIYAFTMADFLPHAPGDDPVQVDIKRAADAYNQVQVEYLDRTNSYRTNIQPAPDAANIAQYGVRPNASPTSLHSICLPSIAATIAQLIVQRACNVRNTYKFRVGEQFGVLNPMDLVTITTNYLSAQLVRIIEMDDTSGDLEITAEEVLVGTAYAPQLSRQQLAGYAPNFQAAPGNVDSPVIVLPPLALTQGNNEVWIGCAGGANWGGAQVWVSYDDTNFSLAGTITASARYGVSTNDFPTTGSSPDTTHSVTVNLANSGGTLQSVSATDAANQVTLSLFGTELIAFQSATLVSANTYTLGTSIWRGLQGTTIADQPSGSTFLRIDGAIFTFPFRADQIGQTIYVKFLSFNQFGQAIQSLASVSPYTFTLAANTGTFQYVHWTELAGVPANLLALTGSEAIQNSILQGSLTGGSVVPAVSASITGQGALATLNRASTGASGQVYSVTYGYLTDSSIYTALGTAAAISGQGSQATANLYVQSTAPASPNNGDLWLDQSTTPYTWRVRQSGLWRSGAVITYGSSAPGSPANGDLWINTLSTPYLIQSYQAGAWVTIATVGAQTGVNLYSSTYGTLGDGAVYTALGTSAAIAGQSAWATYNTLSPTQLTQAPQNLLSNPTGALGLQNWTATNTVTGGSSTNWRTLQQVWWGWWFEKYLTGASPLGASADYLLSNYMPAVVGRTYSISGYVFSTGIVPASSGDTRGFVVALAFINSSNATIGEADLPFTLNSGQTSRLSASGTAPTGTVKMAVFIYLAAGTSFSSSSAEVGAWAIKVEANSVSTLFSDETTNGALTTSIYSPAYGNQSDSALITALGVAGAITGQGALATQNSLSYGSSYLTGFGGLAPLNYVNTGASGQVHSATYGFLTDTGIYTPIGTAAAVAAQGNFATNNFYVQATAPTLSNGTWWADTTTSTLKVAVGGAWNVVANISPTTVSPTAGSASGGVGATSSTQTVQFHVPLTVPSGVSGHYTFSASLSLTGTTAISPTTKVGVSVQVIEETSAAGSQNVLGTFADSITNTGGLAVTNGYYTGFGASTLTGTVWIAFSIAITSGTSVGGLSGSLTVKWDPL